MSKRVTMASLQLELAETKNALATAEQKLENEIARRQAAGRAANSNHRALIGALIDQEKYG